MRRFQRSRKKATSVPIKKCSNLHLQVQINKQGVKRLGEEVLVRNPASWPNVSDIETTFEPIVKGTIICPSEQMGEIMGLITEYR